MSRMKILFVGHLNNGETSRMRMEELRVLGNEVIPFSSQARWSDASWFSRQIQQRVAAGPIIRRLNKDIIDIADQCKPGLLWAEKQEHLYPSTIEALRRRGIRTLHFTPDPYFSLPWKRTRLMDEALPRFDYLVTSKRYELDAYERTGSQVIYMPLGFAEQVHRPLCPGKRSEHARFVSDISFLGGWEPRREQLLSALGTTGACMKIWGYAWDHLLDGRWSVRRAYRLKILAGNAPFRIGRNSVVAGAWQGPEVYADEYAWALSSARIGVGFLRTICPDQHTTRSFEIPACASMLLADRTDEHQEFFEEGKEAEFFGSQEELVDKARYYIGHESQRQHVAQMGYRRSMRSGYSYRERLALVLAQL